MLSLFQVPKHDKSLEGNLGLGSFLYWTFHVGMAEDSKGIF